MATANSIAADDAVLTRLENLIGEKSMAAWEVYNVLAFMVEALPDDTPGVLPTRCTLVNLRRDMDHLASSLSEIQDEIAALGWGKS